MSMADNRDSYKAGFSGEHGAFLHRAGFRKGSGDVCQLTAKRPATIEFQTEGPSLAQCNHAV